MAASDDYMILMSFPNVRSNNNNNDNNDNTCGREYKKGVVVVVQKRLLLLSSGLGCFETVVVSKVLLCVAKDFVNERHSLHLKKKMGLNLGF